MDRELTITPLLVNHQPKPSPSSWVKIFIFEPAEAEVKALRGQMYAVLSVSSTVPVDFAPIMQVILEELQNQYFQKTDGGILLTLESALDEIHKKLLLMGQQDKRLSAGFSFNLLTAVSWGTVLYFGQLGASRASMLRKNILYNIDEGENKSTTLYMSSGILQPHDRIVLGTSQLFDKIPKDKMQDILNQPADSVVKSMEKVLSSGKNKSMESAIVLLVDIKQVPSVEEESLRIADPSQGGTIIPGRRRSPLFALRQGIGNAKDGLRWLIHWQVAGKFPVLPILIGVVALILLSSSIWWSISSHQSAAPTSNIDPIVSQIKSELSQAKDVAAVNPDRAQDLANQAGQNINRGLALQPQNSQLIGYQSQLSQFIDQLNNASTLGGVKTLLSLNVSAPQPRLTIFNNDVYLSDRQKGQLIRVSDTGKQTTLATNTLFGRGLLAASDGQLTLVASQHVYPVSDAGQLGSAVALAPSVQPKSLTGFNQNAYLFDSVGQIWRIPEAANAQNPPTTYFGQPIDGTSVLDVAVDGSIYILRQGGTVDVYLDGQKQDFSMERPNLATHASAIFANQDSDKLYLMGPNNLLVWSKSGKYVGQYFLPDRAAWQMSGIDFTAKTIYILSEGKLFKTNLP